MSQPYLVPQKPLPPRELPPGEVEIHDRHGVIEYVVRDLAHIAVAFALIRQLEGK